MYQEYGHVVLKVASARLEWKGGQYRQGDVLDFTKVYNGTEFGAPTDETFYFWLNGAKVWVTEDQLEGAVKVGWFTVGSYTQDLVLNGQR